MLASPSGKAQVKWQRRPRQRQENGGVLAKLHASRAQVESLILGVGINVNISRNTMDHLYGEAAAGATSMYEALGHTIDRNVLAAQL